MSEPREPAHEREDETRRAGRGLLLIATAKIVFIVSAYAVRLALPRVFGSEQVYGLFSVAFSAVSILNNVLIASTIQTVSKMVSEDEARAPSMLRHGLLLQALIGVVLAAGLGAGAPIWAEHVLLNPGLTPLFRVAGVVVLAYAIYAALVGSLNGRRRFQHQAGLDMGFSALRTTGLIGGATLGLGALGAMGGFATASCAILAVALATVGLGRSGAPFEPRRWLSFMAPIWFYQACINGILQIDLQILNRTATELALTTNDAGAASEIANVLSAHYNAAQTFAFVPYQLILSVTFIVFPFVSRATSLGDAEATRRYIRNAMRFSVLVLLAIAAPIGGAADGVMRIAYPEPYLAGAGALGVLVFGQVAFAMFVIGATILSGAGRPLVAALIALGSLIVVVVATRVAITTTGLAGSDTLVATAVGTSIGTVLALVVVGLTVWRSFGAFLPIASALRAALAGGAGFAAAKLVPHGSAIGALTALVAGVAAYAIALVLTREIGRTELDALRAIVRRRTKKP